MSSLESIRPILDTVPINFDLPSLDVNSTALSKVTVNLLASKTNLVQPAPLKGRKATKYSLKSIAIVNSCIGRISFYKVATNSSSNPVLGEALGVGNIVAFGALLGWVSFSMINAETAISNEAEKKAVGERENRNRAFYLVKGLAATTAVVSMLPWAYVTYTNNDNNILFPIVTILSDSILPGYSLWLSAEELRKKQHHSEIEEKLHNVKTSMLQGLVNCENALLALTETERHDLITNLNDPSDSQDINTRAAICVRKILLIQDRASNVSLNKFVASGLNVSGFTIMLSSLYLIGTIGYHLMEVVTDNEYEKIGGGLFMSACTTHMYWNTILNTPRLIANGMNNFFRGSKPLAFQYRPKLTVALELSALLATSLGWGPTKRACDMYFSGTSETVMTVLTVTGVSLMLIHALTHLVSDITKASIKEWGDEDEKDFMKLYANLRQYQMILRESAIPEFARFLKVLPSGEIDEWMKLAKINTQMLDQYLAKLPHEETPLLENV